ncbi:hypothetical protein [uncultured Bacteroides sp.]|uniref:hypothetical protein n=1 Tax=uncultured Bacteroides sp. TaxID=162156 RepID=UPI002AAC04DC|nr:hypothetical protein [uncultured Bacteroides sp.]
MDKKLPPAFFGSRREFAQHPVTFQKKAGGMFFDLCFLQTIQKNRFFVTLGASYCIKLLIYDCFADFSSDSKNGLLKSM